MSDLEYILRQIELDAASGKLEDNLLEEEGSNVKNIRIGIDVGGTFTHAVALEHHSLKLIGSSCVPTTHKSEIGVASGVVDALTKLLRNCQIDINRIGLIAHSTTQATNALLEGDVAKVGVIGIGRKYEKKLVVKNTDVSDIKIGNGKKIKTSYCFVEEKYISNVGYIKSILKNLKDQGCKVLVVSQQFAVDNATNEKVIVKLAEENGWVATASSSISKLYGLKVRTRTAIVNAAMIPKMLDAAKKTESSIRTLGIEAPLMIMRSDGGIMAINEMYKRPILTLLSGAAAGVAAALMYSKISDGIFVEVGGTSSDISVIKNGKPQIKTAEIGGQRLYLNTLDVRSIGIGGGSLPRIHNNKVIDVGPRSSHIAALKYISYSPENEVENLYPTTFQPLEHDHDDYLKLEDGKSEQSYSVTPTGASYFLNLVDKVGHGEANMNSIKEVFSKLEKFWNVPGREIAQSILKISTEKVVPTIKKLKKEYDLEDQMFQLIGGGGGASSIVPFTGKTLGISSRIIDNSEIISAIGTALAMIKETVERNIITPTESDIVSIRNEAFYAVKAMGAAASSIQVDLAYSARHKKLIATAVGTPNFESPNKLSELSQEEIKSLCAESFHTDESLINEIIKVGDLSVWEYNKRSEYLFGLIKTTTKNIRVIDKLGRIRLQVNNCAVKIATVRDAKSKVSEMLEELTSYGDAGCILPSLFVIVNSNIIDLTGLITEQQIISLLDIEFAYIKNNLPVLIIGKETK